MISGERHRKNGDPTRLKRANTKSHHARKGRYDGSFTPSEQRLKNKLMKQFTRLEGPSGNSAAYLESPVWCACGFGMNRRGVDGSTVPCRKCAPNAKVEALS